ncbi:hypothetical protein Halru_2664 [Halovivax ruber XH-70]|uniref:Uncharacterized protein n=1 Tax=Halovivax ruber (strain DSM 18193 / JCM 13892 / XH-70) TaxID=797302 RepID=L0ICE7_HALRX|nr:hypothetical protein [Halovivax ruber]AGB17240.1 hypothetical protein Halru_2664 [Halovivax ruber XH-70]
MKNVNDRLDNGLKTKDKFVESLGKFEGGSIAIGNSGYWAVVIGTKRNGIADDLDPNNFIRGSDVGPRESLTPILKNGEEVDKDLRGINSVGDVASTRLETVVLNEKCWCGCLLWSTISSA